MIDVQNTNAIDYVSSLDMSSIDLIIRKIKSMDYIFLEPRDVYDPCIVGFIDESVCYNKEQVFRLLVESYLPESTSDGEAIEHAHDCFDYICNSYDLPNPPLFLDKPKWQKFCLKFSKTNITH